MTKILDQIEQIAREVGGFHYTFKNTEVDCILPPRYYDTLQWEIREKHAQMLTPNAHDTKDMRFTTLVLPGGLKVNLSEKEGEFKITKHQF